MLTAGPATMMPPQAPSPQPMYGAQYGVPQPNPYGYGM